jgi:hypothetical protein
MRSQSISPIPPRARERVIERHPDGSKSRSEFRRGRELVAIMLWEPGGLPAWGWGVRKGKMHGLSVEWHFDGSVCYVEHWRNGMPHGVARQFDNHGNLLLETRYVNGTGVDLYCGSCWSKDNHPRTPWRLSEEHRLIDGGRQLTRWWNSDERTVHGEEQYRAGVPHGVFREWNDAGKLRRGFPRYFVAGKQVTKRCYLAALHQDPSLPPYRARDDKPRRELAAEYVIQPVYRDRRRHRSR